MKNPHTYTFLNALLTAWKAKGQPSGIDAYLRITQLVEALPEGIDFADLKTLIAPIIVTSPQQQADFYETFDRVLNSFDFDNTPLSTKDFFVAKSIKMGSFGFGGIYHGMVGLAIY